jgi:hypothetical protein
MEILLRVRGDDLEEFNKTFIGENAFENLKIKDEASLVTFKTRLTEVIQSEK